MKKKRIKVLYYIIICITLILFLLVIFFNEFKFKNKKLNKIAYSYIEKEIYDILNNDIYNYLKSNNQRYTKIYKNTNEEIVYIDYDLKKLYESLQKVTGIVDEKLSEFHKLKNRVPFNMSENFLIYNIGPKLNLYINTIDSVIGNISTNVTDYGMNNALLETYITLKIKVTISSGINSEPYLLEYKYLINSELINGKIPSYYGNSIKSSFDVPIEN